MNHRIEATVSLREERILSLGILTLGTDCAHAIEQLVCKLGLQIWNPLVSNEAQAERELHCPQVLLVQMTKELAGCIRQPAAGLERNCRRHQSR